MATDTLTKPDAADSAVAERTRKTRTYRPLVDIVEHEDKLVLFADVPGARADAIDIDYQNGTLTIHAKLEHRQPDGTAYLLHEYGVGDFVRSFRIGEHIDAAGITASMTTGVLTLNLPKTEQVRRKRIAVKADS